MAATLNNAAVALERQGQLDQALAKHGAVYKMRVRWLGGEHADVADTLNNTAVVLERQGKLAEAESKLDEALAIYQATAGVGRALVDSAAALGNKASVLFARGSHDDASAAFERAYGICRQAGGCWLSSTRRLL